MTERQKEGEAGIFPKDKFKCPKCGEVSIGLKIKFNDDKLNLTCRRCDHVWQEKPLDEREGEIDVR